MASLKHSKYKNTGVLFELLVRQITSDLLEGQNSKASSIIKKYFVGTELSKEYKLYEFLFKETESKNIELILNTLLEYSKKLDHDKISNEKYNLIKEIKSSYNIKELFQAKIPHYKPYAALSILLESHNTGKGEAQQIIDNKLTIIEHFNSVPTSKNDSKLLKEYSTCDKEVRYLTLKILMEKFNGKYDGLIPTQKRILKEFINSVDSKPTLKQFYDKELKTLKGSLQELNSKVDDKVTSIRLNEVINHLEKLENLKTVKEDDLINLLQLSELEHEIKNIVK